MGKNQPKSLKPRDAIVRMEPYHPPTSGRGGKLRLDFNENTVGSLGKALAAVRKLSAADLAMYAEYDSALPEFARRFRVRPAEMTLTNGSDEAIQLIVNTYVNAGEKVLMLRPTYAMYRFYSQIAGAAIEEVDYGPDLSFPAHDLTRRLNRSTRAVLLANPNNPTGTSASNDQLRAILEAAPRAAVLVDEAYFEFSGQSVLRWIGKYPSLFVCRTFSKAYGLAALRIGCLFSHADNITAIRKGQSPYSVNMAGVAGALAALKDQDALQRSVAEVMESRRMLCDALDALSWNHFPSDANFVLVEFGSDAAAVCDLMSARKVLLRDRSYQIAGCVRITVGTISQTHRLIRELKKVTREVRAGAGKR